jgi:NAD(P)-dependent dehydrogenase (short-subunit alcohol dehydrogenase family)
MTRLEGKSVIVTGAAHGIGRAIAIAAAAEGAFVTVTDVDAVNVKAVCDEIVSSGGRARFVKQDVTDPNRWHVVIDGAVAAYGRLDALVNNAGIQLSRSIEETSLEQWRRVFAVNAEAAFLGTRCASKVMKGTHGGSIVNISSTLAMVPLELNAAYCASKAAITQFTKVAALEAASGKHKVRVNSIHPGVIATPMIEREIADVANARQLATEDEVRDEWKSLCPLGIGEPEDIAYGAIYLMSDEARYVTGTELVIDGGHLLR